MDREHWHGLKVGNFANEVKPASPLETPQRTWSIIADRASRSEALKRKVRAATLSTRRPQVDNTRFALLQVDAHFRCASTWLEITRRSSSVRR
jgi:hypothetical protein